jgi:hypothetical protein
MISSNKLPEDGSNFGEAIKALQDGERVLRTGWNGKNMFLELQVPDANSKMTQPYIFMNYNVNPDTSPNRIPWLASQADMLSEDWQVLART